MAKKYKDELLKAFLECRSIKEIMATTGLSRATIERYRDDKGFKEELTRLKMESIRSALNRMQLSLTDITHEVLSIAKDKKIAPQIRLNAAQILMSQCKSWTETEEVLTRLAAVEEAIRDEKT
ncbi:MAG: hypothetical protein HFE30_07170 [Clostridiales bacterium]|nr:hypothetical protein [Clostridiales bacterium]